MEETTETIIVQAPPMEEGFSMSYVELLTGPLSALALAVIMIVTIGRWLARFVPQVVAQTEAIVEKIRSTSAGLHNRLNAIEPVILDIKAQQNFQSHNHKTDGGN
jgi:hypothetical protein